MFGLTNIFWKRVLEAFVVGVGGYLFANYTTLLDRMHGGETDWWGLLRGVAAGAFVAGLQGAWLFYRSTVDPQVSKALRP